jgi:RNA polymerase sigma factor (sigma-70 family)
MKDYEPEFMQLLQEIAAGSEAAAREQAARKFLAEYGNHILRIIRRRLDRKLRSKFDSMDFMQDVWASFFAEPPHPEAFASPESFLGYLSAMARNKVADATRYGMSQRRTVNRENSLEGSARFLVQGIQGAEPTPSEVAVAKEYRTGILGDTTPSQENMVRMLELGYTHEQVAENLGLNVKQVQRLVQKLKARFVS